MEAGLGLGVVGHITGVKASVVYPAVHTATHHGVLTHTIGRPLVT